MDPLTSTLFRMGGASGSEAAGPYWISQVGISGVSANSMCFGDNRSVYVVGRVSEGLMNPQQFVIKYGNEGDIIWQRRFGGSLDNEAHGVASDSSGSVYIVGFTKDTGDTNSKSSLVKYDLDGNLQWQRTLSVDSSDQVLYGVTLDTSNNIYVCGYTSPSPTVRKGLLAKYDSTGVLQWQKNLELTNYSLFVEFTKIIISGDGSINIIGYVTNTTKDILLSKYNIDGTYVLSYTYSGANVQDVGKNLSQNFALNRMSFVGSTNSGFPTSQNFLTILLNSGGTSGFWSIINAPSLASTVLENCAYGTHIVSPNNVYVSGCIDDCAVVHKYILGTAGVEWRRNLSHSSIPMEGREVLVDSLGGVYLCASLKTSQSTPQSLVLAKLPGDGSRTGVYGNFSYLPSTNALSSSQPSSIELVGDTFTQSNGTSTSSTSTYTSNPTSFVQNYQSV